MWVELSNGKMAYLVCGDSFVSFTVWEDRYTPKFFVTYTGIGTGINIYKLNKHGSISRNKVSKADREYYTAILKNFILANTDFPIE